MLAPAGASNSAVGQHIPDDGQGDATLLDSPQSLQQAIVERDAQLGPVTPPACNKDSTTPPSMQTPSPMRAYTQYALAHNMSCTDVTDAMLEENGGMWKWATLGLDLGSRGDIAQQFNRALAREPDEVKEMFGDLDSDLKTRCRAEWSVHKSFFHGFNSLQMTS